tara:strand:- start:3935 stop:4123 length:189 start_codon:yes stop_codon:yes gene_type:complete
MKKKGKKNKVNIFKKIGKIAKKVGKAIKKVGKTASETETNRFRTTRSNGGRGLPSLTFSGGM